MSRIKLGDKVRDKISGYEGVVTATLEYLNGCNGIQITPQKSSTDDSDFGEEFHIYGSKIFILNETQIEKIVQIGGKKK